MATARDVQDIFGIEQPGSSSANGANGSNAVGGSGSGAGGVAGAGGAAGAKGPAQKKLKTGHRGSLAGGVAGIGGVAAGGVAGGVGVVPLGGYGKRLTGLNREVQALHGDRPPPVVVTDVAKTYRAKPKKEFRPRRW